MSAKRTDKQQKSSSSPRTKAASAKAGRGAAKSSPGTERLTQLERLIELMVQKDVVEVELEDAGTRWRVRRSEPQAVTFAAPNGMQAMAMPHPGHYAGSFAGGPAAGGHQMAAPAGAPAAAEPQGEVFKSPMLGTLYRAASPESEVFCKPGDRVSADKTLCIIEAMKVMNEIKAEREFEILDVLVKNGEPVEFGQPLFLIR